MQKISSHLWFDKEAKEAAEFYASAFKDSETISTNTLHNTPSGDVDVVTIKILDHTFTLISAGPLFKFTPAISFLVSCATKEEVDAIWEKLSVNGTPLMDLGSYPFSDRYGWIKDKYGLTWQIMYVKDEIKQYITPTLMFVGDVCGKTEEAVNFYVSIFRNSSIEHFMRYNKGEEPDVEGTVRHAGFTIEGQAFAAMDSAREHDFTFTEAISFLINCDSQEEIDYYWEKLSADPNSEQCGWLKDKYGVSWQVNPVVLNEMMLDKDPQKVDRVTKSFLQMKKFDIEELKKAFEGE